MIGYCLVQSDTQERADPQRISGTPRHPPLTVNTFEIAHHQQPKVDARCKSRPTERLRIEPLTQAFYKLIKMAFVQQSVEPFVERMAGRTRQCRRRNPQLLLPLPLLITLLMSAEYSVLMSLSSNVKIFLNPITSS